MLTEFMIRSLHGLSKIVNLIGIVIGTIGILRGATTLIQLIQEYLRIISVKGTYFKTKIEVEQVKVNEEVMAHDHRPVFLNKWDRDADHFRWTRNQFLIYFSYIDYKGDICFGYYVTIKNKKIRESIDIYYHPAITSKYVIDRAGRKQDFKSTLILLVMAGLIISPSPALLVLLKIIVLIACCSMIYDVGV